MSNSRLNKLGCLLESRNRALRSEAVATLLQLTNYQQPESSQQIFALVTLYWHSPIWEGRVAASELFCSLLSKAAEQFKEELTELAHSKKEYLEKELQMCLERIQVLKLSELLDRYQILVSSEQNTADNGLTASSNILSSQQMKQQRRLVDQHLEMNSETGVSSQSFITDEELSNSNDTNFFLNYGNKEDLKHEKILDEGEIPLNCDQNSSEKLRRDVCKNHFNQFISYLIHELFLKHLLRDLVDPKWQIRHGAALSLAKVCIQADKWLFHSPQLLSFIAIRLIQLLCLDRFCDFVTGSNAITPVREAAAQALSGLLLKLTESENERKDQLNFKGDATAEIAVAILEQIAVLLEMQREQHWQCRQTALLVVKYHFAISSFTLPIEHQLFHSTLNILQFDPVDEVISAASQALCSLFANPRLDEVEVKGPLIGEVVQRLWAVFDCSERLAQFRDGIDSVLVDLLSLLAFWFHSKPSNALSASRLKLLVELLDCSAQQCHIKRVQKVLECISAMLYRTEGNESIWIEEVFFTLLKRLYRCVLFCPPSGASTILPNCQQTLELLLEFCQKTNTMHKLLNNELTLSIGLWISCLLYEHKNPEIDVYLHKIDGPTSNKNSPRELLCGEELRFFNQMQIDETILERKVTAARWLAPLLHSLYCFGRPIAQQPMFISVQLLLLPYLRSNSLYQKLGSTIIAQAWAIYQYIQQVEKEKQQNVELLEFKQGDYQIVQLFPVPSILVKELEQQFAASIMNKLYDEVTTLVNILSQECNEFQQYCLRKGLPREELVPLSQANSMEDVIFSAFNSCENRLKRAIDKQALAARHAIVVELIAKTKLGIRTYTNRINALTSSALFFLSNRVPLPAQLTPLIKPLIEALELEDNHAICDLLFAKTFPTLFAQTNRRQPCPHAKLLKQLSNGLGQCEQNAPKLAKWAAPELQCRLLSMEPITLPTNTKARNCEMAIRNICSSFEEKLAQECPELLDGQCCSLEEDGEAEKENLETLLLQMDFFRIVFCTLSNSKLRRKLIDERIRPRIGRFMQLLAHPNPAVRFRITRFLADLTSLELCLMLKLIYNPLNAMISGPLSTSEFARCGAAELLARLTSMGERLLGAVSFLSPLALRAIGDYLETVRSAAATAFRQLVTLLPIENRQTHFLHELVESSDEKTLLSAYLNSFTLIDVLSCPGNLPKLSQQEIPWLRADMKLRDYQLEGITWLSFLNRFGLNGILADDMGLGKTIQVISLLAWDYERRHNSASITTSTNDCASLIVCPRTLIDHWCKEWRSYFPTAKFCILKIAEWKALKAANKQLIGESILIASYEELRSNRNLSQCRWHYVVLDEGHCIRNPSSQLFEVVSSLQSAHRLILSGTPVQNSPADLWALFTFLMPGYLSTRAQFQAKFMRHIMACLNPKASEQQIKEGEQALQLLHKQCLPFIMRRLKSEVLTELPDKIVQDRSCELTVLQRQLYTMLVDRCSLVRRRENQQKADANTEDSKWMTPLQVLHCLRKLVDHPSLIANQLLKIASAQDRQLLADNGLLDQRQLSIKQSGKMVALFELLAECQIGDRIAAGTGAEPVEAGSVIGKRGRPGGRSSRRQSIDQRQGQQSAEGGSGGDNSSECSSPLDPTAQHFSFALPSTSTDADLLNPTTAPHRALIFCQWRATLELIAHFLDNGMFGQGISYLRLDGCTPPGERQALVDRFNADPSIDLLLLTTHIGGVGLNLTGADVVIFVDHDWNPFRDLQAIDRAHRLGQRRNVNVYRLITQGTIEEKVMRLQQFKEHTANTLVGANNRSLASMATDELLELFTLGTGDADGPKPPTNKKVRLETGGTEASESGWTMDNLWGGQNEEEGDEELEQYAEQHSVHTFLQSTTIL